MYNILSIYKLICSSEMGLEGGQLTKGSTQKVHVINSILNCSSSFFCTLQFQSGGKRQINTTSTCTYSCHASTINIGLRYLCSLTSQQPPKLFCFQLPELALLGWFHCLGSLFVKDMGGFHFFLLSQAQCSCQHYAPLKIHLHAPEQPIMVALIAMEPQVRNLFFFFVYHGRGLAWMHLTWYHVYMCDLFWQMDINYFVILISKCHCLFQSQYFIISKFA